MRRSPCDSRGFTTVELLLVIGLIAVVSAMAGLSVQASLPTSWGDAAMAQVVAALRDARTSAISARRDVEIRVTAPDRLEAVRLNLPAGETTIRTVTLGNEMQFLLPADVPDTPDRFGQASAVDFGGAASVRFQADGILGDAAGVPVNGTLFMWNGRDPKTVRAVTLTGATGRPQGYRWTGSAWR